MISSSVGMLAILMSFGGGGVGKTVILGCGGGGRVWLLLSGNGWCGGVGLACLCEVVSVELVGTSEPGKIDSINDGDVICTLGMRWLGWGVWSGRKLGCKGQGVWTGGPRKGSRFAVDSVVCVLVKWCGYWYGFEAGRGGTNQLLTTLLIKRPNGQSLIRKMMLRIE